MIRSVAFVCVSLVASVVSAQSRVNFQNSMQTIADVFITPVGSTTVTKLTIGEAGATTFAFDSRNFDIQVVPRDAPDTGFRFFNVDLRQLSTDADGQNITLNGSFADDVKKLVCKKRRCRSRRCRCYYVTTRGERTAVGLEITRRDGTRQQIVKAPMEKSY